MPKFEYLGKEKSGHMVSGDLDAKNRNEAVSLLIEKGLTPIKINECKRGIFKSNSKREGRISGKEKVVFSRQLAILINSGLPLAQSFSILQKQTSNQKFKKIIEEVGKDLQGGISLSDALSKHPKAFSTIFVNMVRAGEIGGTLDQTLERLANQMEKDREIIAKVRNAMMYPSVIIVAMIGAVTFLMVKVVPQLSTIFEDMGGELPINTRALIFISNVLKNYLIFVILSVVGTIYALRRLVKTNKKFKFHFNAFLLKVPLIKMVIIKLNTARFARTLGMLLNSGIPVMESLEIVNNSISNEVFLRKLAEASNSVKNVQTLSGALTQTALFPPLVCEMISVGEETGNLEEILAKLADFNDKELDSIISNLSAILEPVIMLALGGIVGFIVISILQPIYTMSDLV